MNTLTKVYVIAAFMLFNPVTGLIGSEPAAMDVMKRVEQNRESETARSRMTMSVYPDARNEQDVRHFAIISYRRGMDDTYMEFVAPRSINGLKVLDAGGATRVFFPSTGRVRNITGRSRSGSVGGVGGDFSYEDMGGGSLLETYKDFKITRTTSSAFIISAVPSDSSSSYSRAVFTVSKDSHIPLEVEYFGRDGELEKRLVAGNVQKTGGRYVALELTMHNIKNSSKTVIRIAEMEFDTAIDDRYFHPNRFYR